MSDDVVSAALIYTEAQRDRLLDTVADLRGLLLELHTHDAKGYGRWTDNMRRRVQQRIEGPWP